MQTHYDVIVIGGGHAGAEAAWAAANMLPAGRTASGRPLATVALVTLDPAKIGVMPCNPAIGGLAKGQIVREVDALGGLMGLAADATGIQFKVLNTSRGPAVRGPRAQCDKHAYARFIRGALASRTEIDIIAGAVEDIVVEHARVTGVVVSPPQRSDPLTMRSTCHAAASAAGRSDSADEHAHTPDGPLTLHARAVVLTTGTFMRGLMHTGEDRTPGGRHGEAPALGIAGALMRMGFETGRLKTGTPPRLERSSIDWQDLPEQRGDDEPTPFSDLTDRAGFPALEQVDCRVTHTFPLIHDLIRANLHRAPMYSGRIESVGPRYCPSIEDKVVRFAQRDSHHVFLEPESLSDSSVYCNGISTSLPADVQERIVRSLPGCARARILRHGYAVEYDSVLPHQIHATGMTKRFDGFFLAGQINGTSGYEEAAAQGVLAGINAALLATGREPITLGRDRAYIGVLMDDLVTKTPVEPYRMFTSRAEHRLLLRADNAADRLTPLAIELGLLDSTEPGAQRKLIFRERTDRIADLHRVIDETRIGSVPLSRIVRRPGFTPEDLARAIGAGPEGDGGNGDSQVRAATGAIPRDVLITVHTDHVYESYIQRQHAEIRRMAETERRRIPEGVDFHSLPSLRTEAKLALERFRPETFGQAARLEGVTPADLTLLRILLTRRPDPTPT